MPNHGTWPAKAAPAAADKLLSTDSVDGQFKELLAGSLPFGALATKTAAYTMVAGDCIIIADTAGGAFTVTLPSAALYTGKVAIVKRNGNGAGNACTVAPASGTIDGGANTSLATAYTIVRVVSDGTNWFIV